MKGKLIVPLLISLLLCSCAQNDSQADETASAVTNETTAESISEQITESFTESSSSSAESAPSGTQSITAASTVSTKETAVQTTVQTTQPPAAPVLTVSNVDHSTNSLSWTAVDGAQSYMLYLMNEETGEPEQYGEISGTSCKDIKLAPETGYTYAVSAVFPDGSLGRMSESADIYTYSLLADNEYAGWKYLTEYNEDSCRIIRTSGSVTEAVTDYCYSSISDICVTGKYIYFIDNFGYWSGQIVRTDMNGENEIRIFHCEEGQEFGCYEPHGLGVYGDTVCYTTYGFWSENDEPSYDAAILCGDEYIDCGFSDPYSEPCFINGSDGMLYMVWRDQEIMESDDEDWYYLYGVNTDKIHVFSAEALETTFVKVPVESADNRFEYTDCIGGVLYINAVSDNGEYMIRASAESYVTEKQ